MTSLLFHLTSSLFSCACYINTLRSNKLTKGISVESVYVSIKSVYAIQIILFFQACTLSQCSDISKYMIISSHICINLKFLPSFHLKIKFSYQLSILQFIPSLFKVQQELNNS